jgi:Homeodomain-like domain
MRPQFRDRWGSFSGRGGRPPPTPEPTLEQRATITRMHGEGRTQVAIADALNVPRSQVRCWYARMGIAPLSRIEGHMIGRANTRERAK